MHQADASVSSIEATAFDRLYRAVTPYAFGAAWLAARALGASVSELDARVGELPEAAHPLIWFHGASAGEMSAAAKLAALLRRHGYRFTAGYTATNRAGVEYVRRSCEGDKVAAMAPWDVAEWLQRAFDRWEPAALFLIETELWPGLVFEACRRGVPVFCASARIYPRDLPRYRAIRRFIGPTLSRLNAVLAQNEVERERLIELGADPARCVVAGNLKYVGVETRAVDLGAARANFGLATDDRVVAFGSIHADEVDFIFAAIDRLASTDVRFIIAPRHPSASDTIAAAAARRGLPVWRRSVGSARSDWRVLVLDTMGELSAAYSVSGVAVVGGGFRNHGGHNPLEPVIAGTPAIFGRHFRHFEPEAAALTSTEPNSRVTDPNRLGELVVQWMSDETRRAEALMNQRRALPDASAIEKRYLQTLAPWLEERCV